MEAFNGARGYMKAVKDVRSQVGPSPERIGSKQAIHQKPFGGIQSAPEQLAHVKALPVSQHISAQNSLDANIGSRNFVGSMAHSSKQAAMLDSAPVQHRTALNDPGPAFAEYCKWQADNFKRQHAKWLREHPVEEPVLRSGSLKGLLEPEVTKEARVTLWRAPTFASHRTREGTVPAHTCIPSLTDALYVQGVVFVLRVWGEGLLVH